MESPLFPYANVLAGVLLLIVAFGLHFVGQLVSVISWEFATRIGLQEAGMPAEFKVYEKAIAIADVAIGWIYGVVVVGLFVGASWAYTLLWIPGTVLVYHSISAWFWMGYQRKQGFEKAASPGMRVGWFIANFGTGALSLLLAWLSSSSSAS